MQPVFNDFNSTHSSLKQLNKLTFLFTIISYSIIYPFYLINLMLSLVLILIISGLSILSLLAGSLIHIQYNYQNIYQIKMNYKFYWIIYLLTSNILILSLSKEIIIHDIFLFINSPFAFIITNLGAIFTTLYTLKIYMYCFWIVALSYFINYLFLSFPYSLDLIPFH